MPEKDKIRILYVDDDQDDLVLVTSLLQKTQAKNYELENAPTLEEALAKLKGKFSVFLIDYKFGKSGDVDLIKEIKNLRKHAPVIMLTGINSPIIDLEALQLGASDYLVKGQFDERILERTMRFAMRDAQLLESLENTAMKFRSIFERAGDPFLLMDQDSKIMEANPMFVNKFGFDPHLDKDKENYFFKDLFEDDAARNQMIDVLDHNLDMFEMEATMHAIGDNLITTLVSIVKQDVNLFQVMVKDLSAIKAKVEEDIYLKKFSSTGRIARLLAHEVKNPLTTIVLSADQLNLELPEEVKKESGDLIDVIRRNCDRINQLVTQLLDSTRFTELKTKNCSINQLLDEALEHVMDRADFKGITIEKIYQKDICEINVDSEKVKIALTNLLVNAIEAMEEGVGKLVLKTYIMSQHCRIEVRDNGVGISKENLERLFEPFFTNKPTGSGLGLTNSQSIILSHGGSIRVKSEVGKGTNFIITFNLA
ncbi:MAG: ATP-binding protein [Algoriphagus sp.]|nr:ATP-binding protein [Algoriphagus sp.]